MFKLNLNILNKAILDYKSILSKCVFNQSAKKSSSLSMRQKIFDLYMKRYENYEHIFYSSYLELQENWELHKSYKNEIKKKNIMLRNDDLNLLQTDSEKLKNWMEDYEYYDAENKLNLEHDAANGSIFRSLNVPCNGCGAILHCKDDKSPGMTI